MGECVADGKYTADRFAHYENDIRVLEAKLRQEQRRTAATHDVKNGQIAPMPTPPAISRFGSFIGSRKPLPAPPTQSPGPREKELQESLAKEKTMRAAAEQRAAEVTAEIEELSVTLFQQANEMVARERKDNAALRDRLAAVEPGATVSTGAGAVQKENGKLKERVRILEEREVDRKHRLEKLEAATRRIERVHALLRPR